MTTQIQNNNGEMSTPSSIHSVFDNFFKVKEVHNTENPSTNKPNSTTDELLSQHDEMSIKNDDIVPLKESSAAEDTQLENNAQSEIQRETQDSSAVQVSNNTFYSPPSSPQTSERRGRQTLQRQLTWDGENASPGSNRSFSSRSLGSGTNILSRPAGMRERMQLRFQNTQSDRHLMKSQNLYDPDDDSVTSTSTRSSRRRISSSALSSSSSSVRDRLFTAGPKGPSIRRLAEISPSIDSSDHSLLLQLTQKVHQLEAEKEGMMKRQKEVQKEHAAEVDRLKTKLKEKAQRVATSPMEHVPSSSATLSSKSAMLELQVKLDKAMLKVSRLEQEQTHRDNLEEKFQDAQMTIANLRLHSTTTPVRQLLGSDVGFSQGQISDSQRLLSEEREENRWQDERHQQMEDESRKAESPPSAKDQDRSIDTTTTSFAMDAIVSDEDTQTRSDKLQKLKDFRRSRESQLKELVLDSQNSPTDVQSVIRNLQDELKAAKEVIWQQKLQLKELAEQHQYQEEKQHLTTTTAESSSSDTNMDTDMNLVMWKSKYLTLQQKYTKLEIDRAWSEFQLRDRITNDALKFHKRLRHWKEQTEQIQHQLEDTMEQQAKETKELRSSLSRQEQAAIATEQDFHEYKQGMEETLKEYGVTQARLAKAMAQLAKYHPERSGASSDPAIMQQAQFLELAKERKDDKNAWSAGWIGKMRQRVVEMDPAVMR